MPPVELRSSIHRFRVRGPSSPATRRRSASPARGPDTHMPTEASAVPTATDEDTSGQTRHASTATGIGSRNILSCDRCRAFKKKCSRTFPTCSLCSNAGQVCSLSTAATSGAAQTRHLQARIEWLTKLVNKELSLPDRAGIEAVETGTELSLLSSPPRHDSQYNGSELASNTLVPAGKTQDTVTPDTNRVTVPRMAENTSDAIANPLEHQNRQNELQELPIPPLPNRQSLAIILASESPSSDAANELYHYTGGSKTAHNASSPLAEGHGLTAATFARQCVDAYFRHVNRAYPFVNKAEMYLEVRAVDDWGKLRAPKRAYSTLLHLVMAIGCTTLQRAGKVAKESSSLFEVAYAKTVQECIGRDDKDSLQVLVLVALYSLYDARGMSAWAIAGIASRQAIAHGLSRKARDKEALSTAETEHRHRLFWSIWVLDRMMAFSLGLPVALTDESYEVPLPGLTVEEFASIDRQSHASMLQTNRHIIQLRQLEDRILGQVLLRKAADVAAMSNVDCRFLIQAIRADIDNWYGNGCLVSPMDTDSVPIHSSITWSSTRYYHLLLFLHYPCPLNSKASSMAPKELLPLAQKCLQLTLVLLQQRQLPLNRVTLCRIFPVGLVLMHCLARQEAAQTAFSAREDINSIVGILDAFPEQWTEAREAAKIFRRFLDVLSWAGAVGERFHPNTSHQAGGLFGSGYAALRGCASTHEQSSLLRSSIAGFTNLMQDVLGTASCYVFHELSVNEPGVHLPPCGNHPMTQGPAIPSTPSLSISNGQASEPSTEDGNWGFIDWAFF